MEDPQYPEHDNYFLSDDNLLLFEYDEECSYVDEVKSLLTELYGYLGVEKAYALIFKYLSDSFYSLAEGEYQDQRTRLR